MTDPVGGDIPPATDPVGRDIPPAADRTVGASHDGLHHSVELLLNAGRLVQVSVLPEEQR